MVISQAKPHPELHHATVFLNTDEAGKKLLHQLFGYSGWGRVNNGRIIDSTIKCFTALVRVILVSHLKIYISVEFGRTIVNSLIAVAKAVTGVEVCPFLNSCGINIAVPMPLGKFTFCCN